MTVEFALDNPRTLRATVTDDDYFWIRRGSFIGYNGQIKMNYRSGPPPPGGFFKRWSRFIGQTLAREKVSRFEVSGDADIWMAYEERYIQLIELDGTWELTVNGDNIIAYERTLDYETRMVSSFAESLTLGLYCSVFHGRGRVAVLTHGPPEVLYTANQRTIFVPKSVVAWSSNLDVRLYIDWDPAAARAKGMLNLQHEGDGFVVIQPALKSTKLDRKPRGGRGGGDRTPGHDMLSGGTGDSWLTGYD